MKLMTISGLAALMCSSLSGATPPRDNTQVSIDAQINKWKIQQNAGESDVKLVDAASGAFIAETILSEPYVNNKKVNEALAPLRAVYPDYRLIYLDSKNFCTVIAALRDARSSAIARINEALSNQITLFALTMAYQGVKVKQQAQGILGNSLSISDIGRVFEEQIDALPKPDIKTTWGSMDYTESKSDVADTCD